MVMNHIQSQLYSQRYFEKSRLVAIVYYIYNILVVSSPCHVLKEYHELVISSPHVMTKEFSANGLLLDSHHILRATIVQGYLEIERIAARFSGW